MQQPEHYFKVVVTGPFSAGKTTFIRTVVQREFLTTAARTSSAQEADVKEATTVGMDFGVLTIEDESEEIELRIYGTPGQTRFDFMWEVLAQGSDAFVIVIDGDDPASWEGARLHHAVMARAGIPGVIAVNRHGPDVVEQAREHFADLPHPVLACDARDLEEVRDALVKVLFLVLERLQGTTPDPFESLLAMDGHALDHRSPA